LPAHRQRRRTSGKSDRKGKREWDAHVLTLHALNLMVCRYCYRNNAGVQQHSVASARTGGSG
jgi:hypothetical protein